MKLIFVICSTLILSSCFHFDQLEYYVDGYSPNNDSLRTNGYYYLPTRDTNVRNYWPHAITNMYFFKDGTFIDDANCYIENLDSLDAWICDSDSKLFDSGLIGKYTIQNDTILIESLHTSLYFIVPLNATRIEYKAVRTENGIKFFEQNGEPSDVEWLFHENPCFPDSVKNWITEHRKYQLD